LNTYANKPKYYATDKHDVHPVSANLAT